MALKITKEQPAEFVSRQFDEDNSFVINPTGLNQFRIVLERHSRYLENREATITSEGFGIKAITIDKEKDKSLFEIQALSMAHHIIKGWTGDIELDGEQAEYTPQNAYDLLISNPQVFTWAINQARELEKERALAIVETVGKSANDSSGS